MVLPIIDGNSANTTVGSLVAYTEEIKLVIEIAQLNLHQRT